MIRKVLVLLFFVIFFSACGERGISYRTPIAPNDLMRNASAWQSAFSFYVFYGETTLRRIVFQHTSHRQGIIDELSSAPAARVRGWTLDDITLPIYGISMGTSCGYGINAAWSNGFWITDTGAVYRFEFDFEDFIQRQPWELPRSHESIMGFPNATFLTRDANGWSNRFLTPTPELNPPVNLDMSFVSNTRQDVTFTLTNNRGIGWVFSYMYRVDVLLDGIWYFMPENLSFFLILTGLDAGETRTKTYGLQAYGYLPPGTYRLVKYDMYVIFEID